MAWRVQMPPPQAMDFAILFSWSPGPWWSGFHDGFEHSRPPCCVPVQQPVRILKNQEREEKKEERRDDFESSLFFKILIKMNFK